MPTYPFVLSLSKHDSIALIVQILSDEMAIRFEKALGLKADTMLRMQTAYDLAQVRVREQEIVVDRVAA